MEAAKKNRGLWRNTKELSLVRWDEKRECTMDNLVLMDYNKADEHMENGLEYTKKKFPDTSAFIERRLETLRKQLGLL